MRGKVTRIYALADKEGITPAYAGKSGKRVEKTPQVWDHPRVCGEKSYSLAVLGAVSGSPPRMRGKAPSLAVLGACIGITPAYAGKRCARGHPWELGRDHPRVCGEKQDCSGPCAPGRGSPPRMRGKDYEKELKTKERGITPAYAGKRLKRSHRIGHFSCILCLFHSVLHRASASGGSRAGPCAPPCLPAQNAVPV